MHNTVIIDFKDFVRKHGRLLLLSMITAVFCFGSLVFCGNIRIDTEELINTPGTTLGWLKIGRFGLVILKRLLFLGTHHVFWSGLLFLLFFSAGNFLLVFVFYHAAGKTEGYPYWVFVLLYGTSSIWCYQVYFSLQQAEIALAMLLLVLAALSAMRASFEVRNKWNMLRFFLAGVFLVLGIGAYQALTMYYIAICLGYFVLFLWRVRTPWQETCPRNSKQENTFLYGGIVRILLHFAVSYGIYLFIAYRWFMSTEAYLMGQKGWGRLPFLQCIKNIIKTIGRVVFWRGSEYFSFYTVGLVLSALAAFWILRRQWNLQKGKCILFVLALAVLYVTPFAMTIFMGEFVVTRAQFALPVAAAFLGMYGVGIVSGIKPEKTGIWKQKCASRLVKLFPRIAGILVLFTVLVQTVYCMRLTYTDDVRWQQDMLLASQVTERLAAECGENYTDKPVIFVGRRMPELKRGCLRSEMYGWSFFEWDYSPAAPTGATHRIVGLLEAAGLAAIPENVGEVQRQQAVELAEQMEDFPQKDSIRETEHFIVVRLSWEQN